MSCEYEPPTQTVHGWMELEIGVTFNWLEFVDARLPRDQAEAEAVRIKCAQHKGTVKRCWVDDFRVRKPMPRPTR